MNSSMIAFSSLLLASCVIAQIPTSSFYSGFGNGISEPFPLAMIPSMGNGVGSTGNRPQGPILFPMSPQSNPSETSGVVVGASGYGFIPPGVMMILMNNRAVSGPSPPPSFSSSLSQPFSSSFFNLS